MTAPTPVVRKQTYDRDGNRCAACGSWGPLEWNHRQSSGHGGRGRKAPSVTPVDGVVACAICNADFEGRLLRKALRYGWKVRKWVKHPELVPVRYADGVWAVLQADGLRRVVPEWEALVMMRDVYGPEYDTWKAAA